MKIVIAFLLIVLSLYNEGLSRADESNTSIIDNMPPAVMIALPTLRQFALKDYDTLKKEIPDLEPSFDILYSQKTIDITRPSLNGWLVTYCEADVKDRDSAVVQMAYILSNGTILYRFPQDAPDASNFVDPLQVETGRDTISGLAVPLSTNLLGIALKVNGPKYVDPVILLCAVSSSSIKLVFVDHSESLESLESGFSKGLRFQAYDETSFYFRDFDDSGTKGILIRRVYGSKHWDEVFQYNSQTGKYEAASDNYRAQAISWITSNASHPPDIHYQ